MHATCKLEIVNKSIVTDREATLRLYVYLSPMILNEPDKSIFQSTKSYHSYIIKYDKERAYYDTATSVTTQGVVPREQWRNVAMRCVAEILFPVNVIS